jgi:hypothetical protein
MNKAPLILLFALLVTLIFILGVRYGQHVEKTNETVSVLLSIPPTKPVPTETPLGFRTYSSKSCDLEFTYPKSLKIEKESTNSAAFARNGKTVIEWDCTATTSSRLKNKKFNPINGRNLYYEVEKSLLPLFENSLKFSLK